VAVGGNGVSVGIGVGGTGVGVGSIGVGIGGTGVGVGGTEVAVGDGPAPQPLITRIRKIAKRNKVSFFIFHLIIFLECSLRQPASGCRMSAAVTKPITLSGNL